MNVELGGLCECAVVRGARSCRELGALLGKPLVRWPAMQAEAVAYLDGGLNIVCSSISVRLLVSALGPACQITTGLGAC